MPTSTLLKINSLCNISLDELEKMWSHAKQLSGNPDNPDYGVVMNIFKKKLSPECLSKLGWKTPISENKVVGVDFDGTLSIYNGYSKTLGPPVDIMVETVKKLLAAGMIVKIFTARAKDSDQKENIKKWCKKYIGQELDVTNIKDPKMVAFFDDRAIQVEKNTGKIIGDLNKIKELKDVV